MKNAAISSIFVIAIITLSSMVAAYAILGTSPHSGEAVDQINDASQNAGVGVHQVFSWVQTFNPTADNIVAIDLDVLANDEPYGQLFDPQTITVSIHEIISGDKTTLGPPLGAASFVIAESDSFAIPVHLDFESSIPLDTTKTYGFQATRDESVPGLISLSGHQPGTDFAGDVFFHFIPSGNMNGPLDFFDIRFATYSLASSGNPCDALDKASEKGKGQKKGIEKAKANNDC